MSAETIPAEVVKLARRVVLHCQNTPPEEATKIVERVIASAFTRPAEPAAPIAEAGDGDVVGWFCLDLAAGGVKGFTFSESLAKQRDGYRYLGQLAWEVYPVVRLSALEAERARADAAEQRAAEALVRAEKAEDWQPIETAKAGELLLLFEPHSMGGFIFVGALNGVWFNNLDQKIQKPTMWRPLPAPPRASREAQPATDGDGNG